MEIISEHGAQWPWLLKWAADAYSAGGRREQRMDKTEFVTVKGDITKDHGVTAIVNAANTSLLGEAAWMEPFTGERVLSFWRSAAF